MNINEALLEQAEQVLGTRGTTQTVHRALEEVVRLHWQRWLIENPVEITPEELYAIRSGDSSGAFEERRVAETAEQ